MSSLARATPLGPLDRGLRSILVLALLASGFGVFLAAPQNALAAPNPPALVQAQGLSGSTIELLWTPVPGATSYKIYRDGATTALATVTATRYDDPVAALSAHSYRVSAVAGTESGQSAAASATAQTARDTTAPTMPGTITASSLTSSSVKLSWGSSTDNVGIEGYRVLRGPTSTSLIDISTTDAVTSFTATNLRAHTTYVFGVLAVDAANNVSGTRDRKSGRVGKECRL